MFPEVEYINYQFHFLKTKKNKSRADTGKCLQFAASFMLLLLSLIPLCISSSQRSTDSS